MKVDEVVVECGVMSVRLVMHFLCMSIDYMIPSVYWYGFHIYARGHGM